MNSRSFFNRNSITFLLSFSTYPSDPIALNHTLKASTTTSALKANSPITPSTYQPFITTTLIMPILPGIPRIGFELSEEPHPILGYRIPIPYLKKSGSNGRKPPPSNPPFFFLTTTYEEEKGNELKIGGVESPIMKESKRKGWEG
jgi:hypothetical protein